MLSHFFLNDNLILMCFFQKSRPIDRCQSTSFPYTKYMTRKGNDCSVTPVTLKSFGWKLACPHSVKVETFSHFYPDLLKMEKLLCSQYFQRQWSLNSRKKRKRRKKEENKRKKKQTKKGNSGIEPRTVRFSVICPRRSWRVKSSIPAGARLNSFLLFLLFSSFFFFYPSYFHAL